MTRGEQCSREREREKKKRGGGEEEIERIKKKDEN